MIYQLNLPNPKGNMLTISFISLSSYGTTRKWELFNGDQIVAIADHDLFSKLSIQGGIILGFHIGIEAIKIP